MSTDNHLRNCSRSTMALEKSFLIDQSLFIEFTYYDILKPSLTLGSGYVILNQPLYIQ